MLSFLFISSSYLRLHRIMATRDDPLKRGGGIAAKRPDDRYGDVERKRSGFDAPPPPRFDSNIAASRR